MDTQGFIDGYMDKVAQELGSASEHFGAPFKAAAPQQAVRLPGVQSYQVDKSHALSPAPAPAPKKMPVGAPAPRQQAAPQQAAPYKTWAHQRQAETGVLDPNLNPAPAPASPTTQPFQNRIQAPQVPAPQAAPSAQNAEDAAFWAKHDALPIEQQHAFLQEDDRRRRGVK